MVTTQKQVRRQALKLSVAALALTFCGAIVAAAPFAISSKSAIAGLSNASISSLAPLGAGPAIQLAKASLGESEDCVRVTRVTGPDGKVYATRGVVCGDR